LEVGGGVTQSKEGGGASWRGVGQSAKSPASPSRRAPWRAVGKKPWCSESVQWSVVDICRQQPVCLMDCRGGMPATRRGVQPVLPMFDTVLILQRRPSSLSSCEIFRLKLQLANEAFRNTLVAADDGVTKHKEPLVHGREGPPLSRGFQSVRPIMRTRFSSCGKSCNAYRFRCPSLFVAQCFSFFKNENRCAFGLFSL